MISAVTGEGIPALLGQLARLVLDARAAQTEPDGAVVIHRPAPEGIEVARAEDGSFVVLGRPALRAVALSDLTDDEAVDYMQRRLRRLGVERALVRAGVRDGDVVHLGALEFTYRRDGGVEGALPGGRGEGAGAGSPAPRRHARDRKSGAKKSDGPSRAGGARKAGGTPKAGGGDR